MMETVFTQDMTKHMSYCDNPEGHVGVCFSVEDRSSGAMIEALTEVACTDPSQEYERQFTLRQQAEDRAADYEANGWTHLAKLARRQAAGHKATLTRIARREGWI